MLNNLALTALRPHLHHTTRHRCVSEIQFSRPRRSTNLPPAGATPSPQQDDPRQPDEVGTSSTEEAAQPWCQGPEKAPDISVEWRPESSKNNNLVVWPPHGQRKAKRSGLYDFDSFGRNDRHLVINFRLHQGTKLDSLMVLVGSFTEYTVNSGSDPLH